ncbi:MAG: M24 family metallopeptidase, partial [Rhodospirillaceae bacterium]|nr:M24 family metallopeptidase [Rhodospirillaceae bacterium]
VFEDAGVEHGFVHTAGYGLEAAFPPVWGLAPIHFSPVAPVEIEPGMVFTVEPPLMLSEEKLGVRVIDDIVVTETGNEILSKADRGLYVIE